MSRRTLALFGFLFFCLAGPAAAVDGDAAIKSALSTAFPRIVPQQIVLSPIPGLYEVTLDNGEIVYFYPASGHLLVGELWNAEARNLTQESKDRRMSDKLAELPLDKAIKIGSGPIQVVEITDPDCPFCRQGAEYFAQRDDVTRYIFLFPLTKLHPNAEAKARYILSSADPAEAYEDVFSGLYDKQPLPEYKDNGQLDLHRRLAREIGVTGTPRYWINGHHTAGFNQQAIEQLLNNQ